MATGKYPFPEEGSVFEILEAIASCDYSIPPFIDPLLADLIRKTMASNPEDRLTCAQILEHPSVFSPSLLSLHPSLSHQSRGRNSQTAIKCASKQVAFGSFAIRIAPHGLDLNHARRIVV